MEHKGTCLLETDWLYLGRFTMKDVHAVYENGQKIRTSQNFFPGLHMSILTLPDRFFWNGSNPI